MTMWLCTTAPNKEKPPKPANPARAKKAKPKPKAPHVRGEIAMRDTLIARGAHAWVALKVDAARPPGHKALKASVTPILDAYLFVECDDAQWHDLQNVPGLTWLRAVSDAYAERRLYPWMAEIDADLASRTSAIEGGERVAPYKSGEALRIIAGAGVGLPATYRGVRDTQDGVEIEAEVQAFGRATIVLLRPGNVAAAA